MKLCTLCGESKPLDAFGPDRYMQSGRRSACRVCERARCTANRLRNKDRVPTDKQKQRRKEVCAAYYQRHREEVNERNRRWVDANPARVLAAQRAFRERNKERYLAKARSWTKANPVSHRASVMRRKALKRKAPGRGVSLEQAAGVIKDAMGRCAYCARIRPLEIDHIEPLTKGGLHDPVNLVAACKSCNSSKHNNTLVIWLAKRSPVLRAA